MRLKWKDNGYIKKKGTVQGIADCIFMSLALSAIILCFAVVIIVGMALCIMAITAAITALLDRVGVDDLVWYAGFLFFTIWVCASAVMVFSDLEIDQRKKKQ